MKIKQYKEWFVTGKNPINNKIAKAAKLVGYAIGTLLASFLYMGAVQASEFTVQHASCYYTKYPGYGMPSDPNEPTKWALSWRLFYNIDSGIKEPKPVLEAVIGGTKFIFTDLGDNVIKSPELLINYDGKIFPVVWLKGITAVPNQEIDLVIPHKNRPETKITNGSRILLISMDPGQSVLQPDGKAFDTLAFTLKYKSKFIHDANLSCIQYTFAPNRDSIFVPLVYHTNPSIQFKKRILDGKTVVFEGSDKDSL